MLNLEKIAKTAANDAYYKIKKAQFDMFETMKALTPAGQFQKQIEQLDLPGNQPFMSGVTQMGMPLFKAIGSAGGLPALAALVDMFRGGGNIGMLTRGASNQNPMAFLRSSTAANPNLKFDPEGLSSGMRNNTATQTPPGVLPPPPPPQIPKQPGPTQPANPLDPVKNNGAIGPARNY